MATLILLRGIPGSGKSTWAKNNYPSFRLLSSDIYFTNSRGEYFYDYSRLEEAHAFCLKKAVEHLNNGESVIVEECFARLSEMDPYFKCLPQGCVLEVIKIVGSFGSIHGVSEQVMEAIKINWQDCLIEKEIENVYNNEG